MAKTIDNYIDPVSLPQLECHFKWFEELNSKYQGQWLTKLLNKQLHEDFHNKVDGVNAPICVNEETLDENEDHHGTETRTLHSKQLTNLSWRFTLVLRNTFEKKFAEAIEITKTLLEVEEAKILPQPQVHVDTYYYVVLATQLNVLEQSRSSPENLVDEEEIKKILERMASLMKNVDSNEGRAVIATMKSNFSRDMGDMKLGIDFAKQVRNSLPFLTRTEGNYLHIYRRQS